MYKRQVIALSAAVVGYWLAPMGIFWRLLLAIGGIVFIAPSVKADLVALLIVAPAVISQILARRRTSVVVGEAG